MGTVKRFKSFAAFQAALSRDMVKLQSRLYTATLKAAQVGAKAAAFRVPVAFGELKQSIRAESTASGARVIADAPHAAPVEFGSRPHWPPLEPLVKWVRLRGAQGISGSRKVRNSGAPKWVRDRLKEYERGGRQGARQRLPAGGVGARSPVDAPAQVARAIQAAIAARGTPPTFFMRMAIPQVQAALDEFVKKALRQDAD